MKIIVVKNYEEMSARAAEFLAEEIKKKEDCVLGLATGDTPVGTYRALAEKNRAGELDFARVRTVNLDEYYPISPENDQSYRYFMNRNFFDHLNIDIANTMVPDGRAQDVSAFCLEYENAIARMGGIDVQLLGIGRNGHIGFNEPAQELVPITHLTDLTPDTINANSRFFESEEQVPKHALTMGMQTVFGARRILILASGKNKAHAVKEMLCGNISTMCPASLLCLHRDVTLICDEDAYSMV